VTEHQASGTGTTRSRMFVVERTLPGLSFDQLLGVQRALAESSRRLSRDGDLVRHLRCTYSPHDARCSCVFEANSADLVRRVNEVAQVPFDRIEEAIDFEEPAVQTDRSGRN